MLGNDFLPHFPALNIRTNGMDVVLETYRNVIGNKCKNLVNNNKIIWKNVRLLIQELGKNEQDNIIQEYKIRNKMKKSVIFHLTIKQVNLIRKCYMLLQKKDK